MVGYTSVCLSPQREPSLSMMRRRNAPLIFGERKYNLPCRDHPWIASNFILSSKPQQTTDVRTLQVAILTCYGQFLLDPSIIS